MAAADDAGKVPAARLDGARVLVVEDGWQLAEALKISLEREGMVVVGPVATPREAERLAAQSVPDIAVVDVNLKGELAYDLMHRLSDCGIQIVVISGYEEFPPSLKRFAAILHKPFTATALLEALRQALRRAAAS